MIVIVLMAAAFVVGLPLSMALIAWLSERPVRPRPALSRRDSAVKGAVAMAALWAALTVAGEVIALTVDVYPLVMSDKGEEIAEAFRVLLVFSVPVFSAVLAVLAYSLVRRGFAEAPGDGPPLRGRGPVPFAWLAVTGGLTALVIVYPGLTSLHAVMGEPEHPDLLVRVEGVQWTWLVSYPDLGVENVRELVLPLDRTVKFDITSRDVLHSFWVPAFLMKVDAVPGLTTTMSLRPTRTGSFAMDPTVRLQCAELCGLGHANMRIPVSVVSQSEFDAWIAKAREARAATDAGGQGTKLLARNLLFDTREISVAAGKPAAFILDNQDAGVPHNFAVYESRRAATRGAAPLFVSRTFAGPAQDRFEFIIEKAGTFFFRCDIHPDTMTGDLIAR